MKRLIAVLAVLVVGATGVPTAQAYYQVDPMAVGYYTPAAIEAPFNADIANGILSFLIVASPRRCNDGSDATDCPNEVRAWFYDSACTRVDTVAIPLTENDVAVVAIHAVSTVTAGSVLVAKADPAAPDTVLVDYCDENPIVGTLFEIFVNFGLTRTQAMSKVPGCSGGGWMPYKVAGIVPFLPPSDGVSFISLLQFRCPTGTALVHPGTDNHLVGTEGTLGGDMLEAESQASGNGAGDGYAAGTTSSDLGELCGACSTSDASNFASVIHATIYDTDENLLDTVSIPCACNTEIPASAISAVAATNSTYWEFRGFASAANFSGGDQGIFTGGYTIVVVDPSVPLMATSGRIHYNWDQARLQP